MKKYLFFTLIPLIFGCKKDLTGHWHAKSTEYSYADGSIDILENNECYFTFSLSSKPIKGEHFPDKKHIFFPGQCGDLSFDYELINNKLYLENALGTKLIAARIDKSCSRFKDFKSKLPIDLLKIKNKRELLSPKDSIKNEFLSVSILIDSKDNKIRIEFFDRINSIDKTDTIIKYIENTHSDSEIPFINYILIPDKKLKTSELKLVIGKFNKGYQKKIFIQTLKVNPKDFSVFEYIKIDNLALKSDNSLDEIIN